MAVSSESDSHGLMPTVGVARVLGARGQNALMAPPPPPGPRILGEGGGVPLEFGQIRLRPLAFDNEYMDMRGIPLRLAKSGADPGFRCGEKMMLWRDTPTPASGVWGTAPAALQLSHF